MLKISGLSRRPNGVSYLYDGDGRRVKSSGGASGTRTYWYDEAGNVVGESGANNAEYFYLAGKMLARNGFGGSSPIKYYYRDHLGTTRMMTDSSGNVCYDGRVAQATMMGCPVQAGFAWAGVFLSTSSTGAPSGRLQYGVGDDNKWRGARPNSPTQPKDGWVGHPASSRVSVTFKIETDPAKNGGNPLIGTPQVSVGTTHFNLTGHDDQSKGPMMPQVTATQDPKTGAVTANIQESTGNPFTAGVDPNGTIKSNLNITVNENATSAKF